MAHNKKKEKTTQIFFSLFVDVLINAFYSWHCNSIWRFVFDWCIYWDTYTNTQHTYICIHHLLWIVFFSLILYNSFVFKTLHNSMTCMCLFDCNLVFCVIHYNQITNLRENKQQQFLHTHTLYITITTIHNQPQKYINTPTHTSTYDTQKPIHLFYFSQFFCWFFLFLSVWFKFFEIHFLLFGLCVLFLHILPSSSSTSSLFVSLFFSFCKFFECRFKDGLWDILNAASKKNYRYLYTFI